MSHASLHVDLTSAEVQSWDVHVHRRMYVVQHDLILPGPLHRAQHVQHFLQPC